MPGEREILDEYLEWHIDPRLHEFGNGKKRLDRLLYSVRRVWIDRPHSDPVERVT